MAVDGEGASSWIPPTLPECGDALGSVLLDLRCYIADLRNATTATGVTSRRLPIQVTFREARPPALSHLCVHCPGMDSLDWAPKVVAIHADLVLLRVLVNPEVCSASTRYWDYFVYRAHPPRLDLLPNPYPKPFNDSEAALISLEDGGYVLASLWNRIPRRDSSSGALIMTEFDLYLYRSSNANEGWVTKQLSVEEPVRDTLVPLPHAVTDIMMFHSTSKVITIGGERGTVAWVDLWRGIILCDLLVECPLLRDIPLPIPARGNWDRLLQECNPIRLRDVTISRQKNSIKYIEMEFRPPKETEETTREAYLVWVHQNRRSSPLRDDGWKATTWTLPLPVASWVDWRREHDVHVNDLTIDSSEQQLFKPLSYLQGSGATAILQRLSVAYPIISMDEDVVYLLSKVDKVKMVAALDLKKKTLKGVAELDTQKKFYLMPSYCSSEICSYLKEITGAFEVLKPTEKEELKPTLLRCF